MKDNATDRALEALFSRDKRHKKETFGEEYKPATLTAHRKGLITYFLKRRASENYDVIYWRWY